MRIATFNLCEERRDSFSISTFLDILLTEKIDVVCLQEFYLPHSFFDEVSGNYPHYIINSCEIVENPLSYTRVIPDSNKRCYSNVIISKIKIYSSSLGDYVIYGGKRIYIINVHLNDSPYQPYQLIMKDYGDGMCLTGKDEYSLFEYSRLARGEAIDDILSKIPRKSMTILCGDFNEPKGYYCSTSIKKHGGRLISPPTYTYSDGDGYSDKIDLFYIFNSKDTIKKRKVVTSRGMSDHDIYWIEIL